MEADRGSGVVNPETTSSTNPPTGEDSLTKVPPQETNAGLFGQVIAPKTLRRSAKRLVSAERRPSAAAAERRRKEELAQKMRDLEFPRITATELYYRHGGWEQKRAKVINAMIDNQIIGLRRQHFENCGSSCRVMRKRGTDELRLVGFFCHDRFCDPCQRQRSKLLAANIMAQIEPDKFNRMITLTLLHLDKPLSERLKHLYHSFKLLRLMPAWRDSQKGGVACLEVKIGTDGMFHPHLHIISQGTYLAGEVLTRCWTAATKDSYRTHIGMIKSREGAAKYVSEYAASPIDDNIYEDAEKLREVMTAMKGVRTANSFGVWRKYKLLAKPPQDGIWEPVCSLQDLLDAVCRKEPWAIAMMTNCQKHRLSEWTDDGEPAPF